MAFIVLLLSDEALAWATTYGNEETPLNKTFLPSSLLLRRFFKYSDVLRLLLQPSSTYDRGPPL